MRDIKRSKAARLYAFSNWMHTYGILVLFVLVVIVSPLVVIPVMATANESLCFPIVVIDTLFITVWCLTPEYKNIEQCHKLMSERKYRKRERKYKKWLI
jgi:fumarate reductase subunit D